MTTSEARSRLEMVVNDALHDARHTRLAFPSVDRVMVAVDAYVQAALQAHIRQEDTGSGSPRP